MQDFLQLKLGVPLKLSMVLINYNKTIEAHLKECIITTLTVDLKESWTLSFKCPYYITDEISREKIVNPNYNLVKAEKLIRVKCNNSYAVFVVKEINISSEDNSKTVTCYSIDKMMSKEIVVNGETIQLKSDALETGIGIFDRMESSIRGWKLRNLDELAKIEQSADVRSNKYRFFDNIEKKWSEFLKNDVTSAFDVLLFFDTYEKKIDCYDRKTYGTDTGWVISKKNISKSISKKIDTKDLITRLYVTGKDDLSIANVNPLGVYVENYDYFKPDMSAELQTALDRYNVRVDQLFVQWSNKNTNLLSLQQQYDTLTSQQTAKEEQIKAKKVEQGVVINSGIRADTSRVKGELDVLDSQLATILSQKVTLQTQMDTLVSELNSITSSMQVENIVDSNSVKIFNNDLLDEFDAYVNENRESNEVFFTAHALYSWAKDKIKEISKPLIEFTVDSQNFIDDVRNYKGYNGIISIADWFYIEHEKLGKEKIRFIGYTYNPDSKSISLKFTNNEKPQSDTRSFSGVASKSIGIERYLSYKKFEWNDASMQKDFVKDLRKLGLDAGLTSVFSESNKNKIVIDKSGIWITNAEDTNKIMVITASSIIISNDGLNSVSTAISTDGITADLLVGRILAGENLYISNVNNDFRIDENGASFDVNKFNIVVNNENKTLGAYIDISTEGIKSTVNSLSTAVGDDNSGLIKRMNTAEQSITAEAIVSKVTSSTEYTGLTNRVTNAESSISQQAGLIALKVEVDGVKSIIQQSPSDITIGFNAITKDSPAKVVISADGLQVLDNDGNVTISNGVVTARELKAQTVYVTGGTIEFDPIYKNGSAPSVLRFNYFYNNVKASEGTFTYWADRFWFNKSMYIKGDIFLTNDDDLDGSNSGTYISAQILRDGNAKMKSLDITNGINCDQLGVKTIVNCDGRINCTELFVNGQQVNGQTLNVIAKFA